MELNARTTLRVRFSDQQRQLKLEGGEIFLTVAKDPARPLTVETTAGSVRVTGTVFNVSNYAIDSLAVILLEGAVDATPAGSGTVCRLAPGDKFLVGANKTEMSRLSPGELADALAWREGKIVFHNTPLVQALERFSHHHARQVTIAPDARDLALGGRFGLDDFDAFLRDLEVALPVVIHREPNGNVRVERVQAEEK